MSTRIHPALASILGAALWLLAGCASAETPAAAAVGPAASPTGTFTRLPPTPAVSSPSPARTLTGRPAASPTANLEEYDSTQWSETSPDGQWELQGTVSFPRGDSDQYDTRLEVRQISGGHSWPLVDAWMDWSLGYSVPAGIGWSSDGRYLYYTQRPQPDGCALFVNGSSLVQVDLRTGRQRTVLDGDQTLWLAISPDDRTLAYPHREDSMQLVLLDIAGGGAQAVPLDVAENSVAGALAWAPGGSRLAVTVAIDPCDPLHWEHTILLVDPDTLQARILVPRDERRFVVQEWLDEDTLLLLDMDDQAWTVDAVSSQLKQLDGQP
ncbi:MAG: hypothetical protein VB089_13060 [Anaerolineaceae bacterium]|nr:hypothetical protein [Anaerolineaceae bacterium]